MGCIEGAAMITGPAAWRLMRTFSSPSVISISPMPDSCTRSISFFSFLRSIVLGFLFDRLEGGLQCEVVHHRSQTGDHALGQVREVRVLPEGLTRMDVGQPDLDERDAYCRQGVAQGDARVGESCWIDDDVSRFVAFRGMNAFDEGGLGVALEA